MIPVWAVIHVRHAGGGFRLWAPLFLVWLVLAPLAVVLSPIGAAVCAARGLNPVKAAGAMAGVIGSLAGVVIEVDSPKAGVLVRIF